MSNCAGCSDQNSNAELNSAQSSASRALFQLAQEEQKSEGGDSAGTTAGAAGTQGHVMLSYCWSQQPVVIRLAAALKQRGHKVWLDVEQMTGSTVDAMVGPFSLSFCIGTWMRRTPAIPSSANGRYLQSTAVHVVRVILSEIAACNVVDLSESKPLLKADFGTDHSVQISDDEAAPPHATLTHPGQRRRACFSGGDLREP